jgi:hypothetical protein
VLWSSTWSHLSAPRSLLSVHCLWSCCASGAGLLRACTVFVLPSWGFPLWYALLHPCRHSGIGTAFRTLGGCYLWGSAPTCALPPSHPGPAQGLLSQKERHLGSVWFFCLPCAVVIVPVQLLAFLSVPLICSLRGVMLLCAWSALCLYAFHAFRR